MIFDPSNPTVLNPIDRQLQETQRVIVGYDDIILKVLYGLYGNFNIVLESVPGLSKTLMIKVISRTVDGATHARIQMTPDLMPADIVGCQIYNKETSKFEVRRGPIFANFVLADEINRTPPKTQSALLQAMQEHEVTIGGETFHLPDPFIAFGTMNPLEQEGTYPLPEAQLDRFGMKVTFSYLDRENERRLTASHAALRKDDPSLITEEVISVDEIIKTRQHIVDNTYVAEALYDYVTDLVRATRPNESGFFNGASVNVVESNKKLVEWGCSPRASFALVGVAQVRAFHQGRDYVIPEDVQFVAADVLCHRIGLTPVARMQRVSSNTIINSLIKCVPIIGGDKARWQKPSK